MIYLEVNGTPYTEFMSASITLAVDTMANDFTFVASSVNDFPPFKAGDRVKCLVDNEQVLDGYIDGVDGQETEGTHTVTYTGRDRTQDFIDSDIDVINDIRTTGELTLKGLIEIVIKHLGQDLQVVDELNPPPFNAAEDILSPKVGQNALEFVSLYAMKRQALLSSDKDGNILITQSSPVETGITLKSDGLGNDDNIISQSWTKQDKEIFRNYINKGQLDPLALNLTPSPDIAGVQVQSAGVSDTSARAGRQRVTVEPKGYSNAQLKDRSKWSRQLSKARATKYACAVAGHSKPDGTHWKENELILIISVAADITSYMLTNSVTFSQAEGSPTTTTFEFVERNVYTIDEQIQSQKKVGSALNAFG